MVGLGADTRGGTPVHNNGGRDQPGDERKNCAPGKKGGDYQTRKEWGKQRKGGPREGDDRGKRF